MFAATREVYRNLAQSRGTLQEELEGSFCILGWTGTSTTDIGVNPFEEEYMNVGTHAAVVNTILSGRFLDSLPWWISALAALGLAVAVYFLVRRLAPLPSILIGLGFLVLIAALGVGFFLVTGSYLNLLTPVLTVFFTLFVLILFKFLVLEKEKSYIRNAFSHYLSTDVINELLADPDKLNLGGEKKLLTAMFTDVRGFSTISESMDPTELVKLLNAYLTEMSNIILELRGTIDKYEGDAIIAFFGAPVDYADHAGRACTAAVRMKKMEKILNEHFLTEKLSPTPLLTRIGINTGEMVVGNMGTAAEDGLHDHGQLGEPSLAPGRGEQAVRHLDPGQRGHPPGGGRGLRLAAAGPGEAGGHGEPVRCTSCWTKKPPRDASTLAAVEIFHQAQALFEARDWDKAAGLFEEVQRLLPGDGPAEVFLKRCREFKKKPPADNWDGVFSLTMK